MYGVDINPGRQTVYHMCKTWLQKVHGGWEIGGGGRGVILNKKIKTIHQILYVLFYVRDVRDTLYKCNAFNTIYVRDVGDTVLYCTFIQNCISHRSVDV